MFSRGYPYVEVRDSLKEQSLEKKQTFLESRIKYFIRMDKNAPNRHEEKEGAIDSNLEKV